MKFAVSSSSNEYGSADTMVIDEAGIDLQIGGETELGGSFENLDNFHLAYAVLPDDFDMDELEQYAKDEQEIAEICREVELEATIWIFMEELAKRRQWGQK